MSKPARAVGSEGATPDATAWRTNITRQGSTASAGDSQVLGDPSSGGSAGNPTERAAELCLALLIGGSGDRRRVRAYLCIMRPALLVPLAALAVAAVLFRGASAMEKKVVPLPVGTNPGGAGAGTPLKPAPGHQL